MRKSGFLNAVARKIVCRSVMLPEADVTNTGSAEAGDQRLFMLVVFDLGRCIHRRSGFR